MPTVAELKNELRLLGLSTAGNKEALESRLAQAKAVKEPAAKRAHVAQAETPVSRLTGPKSAMNKTGSSELQRALALYQSLVGNEPDMGPEQTLKMCELLDVDPENVAMIVLSYRLGSPTMGYFKQEGFVQGLLELNAFTLDAIKAALPKIQAQARWGQPEFDVVYTWAYGWACESGQKMVQRDVAVGLWKLMVPKAGGFDLIGEWLDFVVKEKVVVSKDLWQSFLRWIRLVHECGGLANFADSPDSSWPVAIDDFVKAMKK